MNPLVELKERLVYSMVAGTQLLQDDFRFKKAIESFAPLAAKNAVFAKIYTDLQKMLQADQEAQAILLLNVLGLVDAVLYTQATYEIEGEFVVLEPTETIGNIVQASYREMQPILQALTTTGSGRLEVLQNAVETKPHIFQDYRILYAMVNDLDDKYAEMAEQIQKILKSLGTGTPLLFPDPLDYQSQITYTLPLVDSNQMITVLKKGFDPQGNRGMAARVSLISAIAKEKENAWYLSVLQESKKEIREQAICALGYCEDNISLLLDLAKKERGKAKEMVYTVLGKYDNHLVIDFWKKEFERTPDHMQYLIHATSDEISDLIAESLTKKYTDIIQSGGKKELEAAYYQLYYTAYKTSDTMFDFYLWILEHHQDLPVFKPEKKIIQYGTYIDQNIDVMQILGQILIETMIVSHTQKVVNFLNGLSKENQDLLERACFAADVLTLSAYDVFEKWYRNQNVIQNQATSYLQDIFYQNQKFYLRTKEQSGLPETYYFQYIQKELHEPLDIRWFDAMVQNQFHVILRNITPKDNMAICQKVGAFYHDRALQGKWRDTKQSYATNEILECLYMMHYCGYPEYQGIALALCKYYPQVSQWQLQTVLFKFREYAGIESAYQEASDILSFYQEKYPGGNTVQKIQDMLIQADLLRISVN